MTVCPDTNIWIDIFQAQSKKKNPLGDQVLMLDDIVNHPLVCLELLLGAGLSQEQRKLVEQDLLTDITIPNIVEVEDFAVKHQLGGSGMDIVDIQIVISCIANHYTLWTKDTGILKNANKMGLTVFQETNLVN